MALTKCCTCGGAVSTGAVSCPHCGEPNFIETIIAEFKDSRDGKVYKTAKIGNQVWMAENLNYTAPGSVCYNHDDSYGAKYGRLYNWSAAKSACPWGWHLPTYDEWTTLVNYAGGEETAGKKLKSTSGWMEFDGVDGNGTDEYGFAALPGGNDEGYSDGYFSDAYKCGVFGGWWSATSANDDQNRAYSRTMSRAENKVWGQRPEKSSLLSVRCVQD